MCIAGEQRATRMWSECWRHRRSCGDSNLLSVENACSIDNVVSQENALSSKKLLRKSKTDLDFILFCSLYRVGFGKYLKTHRYFGGPIVQRQEHGLEARHLFHVL